MKRSVTSSISFRRCQTFQINDLFFKVSYTSDAVDSQRPTHSTTFYSSEVVQKNRVKELKADLTRTSFKLGPETDDDKSKFITINQLGFVQVIEHPMDANEYKEKIALNKSLKESVKKSSIVFGNEKGNPIYESVMMEQMRCVEKPDVNEIMKRKKEIHAMKKELRDPKFKTGVDYSEEFNVDQYETNYKSGYGSVPIGAYRMAHSHKDEIANLISDSRETHFSIEETGYQQEYKSISHDSMENVYKNAQGVNTSKLRYDELQRTRALKAGLVNSSFEIGWDKEYF